VPRNAAEEETLKTKLIIAALILTAAVLSPANAAPILLTASLTPSASGNPLDINLTGSYSGDYIVATGYDGGLTGTVPPTKTSSVTIPNTSGDKTAVAVNSAGTSLGLGVDSDEIGYNKTGGNDYVVLDFSDHAATAGSPAQTGSSVSFGLNIDVKEGSPGGSYWVVYGFNSNNGTGTPTLLASGEMKATGAVPTVTTAFYDSYVIGILGDCQINITGITASYGTPEPGTFMMGGLALIGFGIAMKKRMRKA
jgi:PEP-CTERM motif